jgi:phospholipase/lecithinase/hemolysin
MTRLRCAILFCMCFIFVQTASAQAARFDAMYIFGDSLSDNGNDLILSRLFGSQPAVPPSESPHRAYFHGRFTNGPVAFEYLWRLLKQDTRARVKPSMTFAWPGQRGAISYAFGGANSGYSATTPGSFPVPGLLGQIEAFRFGLWGGRPKQQALYALWVGSNDYIPLPPALPASPTTVVANIKTGIQRLYQLGGRQFLVLNMPDLGQIPAAQAQGAGPLLRGLSLAHNALLSQAVAELSVTLPGIKLTLVDVLALEQRVRPTTINEIPALETLAPGSSSCLLLNAATCPDVELTLSLPFYYWDIEHPTTYVHGILGQALYDALRQ